jgi:hypothetical protein
MQSAIVAVILWSIGGLVALRSATDPSWLGTARLLVTTYQLVSGVVYTIIVAEAVAQGISIQVPLSSQVLHYWMPAYALLDWLITTGRPRVPWGSLGFALVFPLAWGAFTMIRGSLLGWYPYFFLDPYLVSGPQEFAAYSLTVLAFIVVIAALLILVDRLVPQRPPSVQVDRSARTERLEAASRSLDDLIVTQLGERGRPLTADEAHQNR